MRRARGPKRPPAPAGTLDRVRPSRPAGAALSEVDDLDLVAELTRRLADGSFARGAAAGPLAMDLARAADVEDNRFSRARLSSQFRSYVGQFYGGDVEGSTFVELGCGDQNPLAVLFLFVLLGAREAIGVDLQPPQDEELAARGLAHVAELMLADPRLVVGDHPVTREEVAAHLRGFDVARLRDGDLGGIDGERLRLVRAGVERTGLPPAAADYVFSTSLLEHLPDVDAALAEAHRITRPGGWGWHVVDGVDHTVYSDPDHPPLAFLRDPPGPALVNGSNRLRPLELASRFERAGFEVVATYPYATVEVTDEERAAFAEPWRSMAADLLAVRGALFFVRRNAG